MLLSEASVKALIKAWHGDEENAFMEYSGGLSGHPIPRVQSQNRWCPFITPANASYQLYMVPTLNGNSSRSHSSA